MSDSSKNSEDRGERHISEEVLSELMDALRPALSSVGERVSEAVAEHLTSSSGSDSEDQSNEQESKSYDGNWAFDDAIESAGEQAVDRVADELGDAKDTVVDSIVDPLFSRRVQGHARRWANETLEQALWELVSPVDDRMERSSLYWELLYTFRPIVRTTVDAVFAVNTRYELKDELKEAIPLLMRGEVDDAVSKIGSAFDHVLPTAKDALTHSPQDMLGLLQRVSTTLLEEKVEDTAEDAIDSADIESRVQQNAEEARTKLQEKISALQEGVGQAQDRLKEVSGTSGSSGRGRPGMPPSGMPPHGFPPHGRPPAGGHPTGRPPHGFPPSGLPPAVERRRKASRTTR